MAIRRYFYGLSFYSAWLVPKPVAGANLLRLSSANVDLRYSLDNSHLLVNTHL